MDTGAITVTLPGRKHVDATVRGHVVRTDQPLDNGGEDSAPSPFEYFLASIATCAGIFVAGFCQKRNIPTEGIQLELRPSYAENGVLSQVELDIKVPADFPAQYRDALIRVADGCSVKKAMAAQPTFTLRTISA